MIAVTSAKNILLLQLGDIGDVVLTTPSIRALQQHFAGAKISVLVKKNFGDLLRADPHVHEVIESDSPKGKLLFRLSHYLRFARSIRQARYDLVIDLRTGDRGALIARLSGAQHRIGRQGISNQRWHHHCFTHLIQNPKVAPPPMHPGADQSLRILRELGITTHDSTPHLYIAPTALTRAQTLLKPILAQHPAFVTINPYSRWAYKEWNDTKWSKLIDYIWQHYQLPCILVGATTEAPAGLKIIAGRELYAYSLAGQTTLSELAAVISLSRLHLGVDSAAPHIAAALGTASITLHGPSDWRAWRISNTQHKIACADLPCLPCNQTGCEGQGHSRCMDELSVSNVASLVQKILERNVT